MAVCISGACMAGGCVWQGACVAGACMEGDGMNRWGHVWQWACMAGGVHARETATEAAGKHPTGMLSYLLYSCWQGF